jgi:hypothetical protein
MLRRVFQSLFRQQQLRIVNKQSLFSLSTPEADNRQSKFSWKQPEFDNHGIIYSTKTNAELLRTYLVFTACSFDKLVDNHQTVGTWFSIIAGGSHKHY